MKYVWSMLLGAAFVMLLLAACNSGENTGGDAVEGEALFKSGGSSQVPCITCHSVEGSTLVGPTLQGIATNAGARMEEVSAEDYIRESITNPSVYLVEGYADVMYKDYEERLSEEEIDNLVAYLMTLK